MKILLLGLLIGAMLVGCGRKGAPLPPGPSTEVTYPRVYPTE